MVGGQSYIDSTIKVVIGCLIHQLQIIGGAGPLAPPFLHLRDYVVKLQLNL